jgi:hypothetical protein
MQFEPQSVNAISKLCGIPHARITEALLGVPEAGRKAGNPTYALETALPAIVASLATPNDPAAMSPRSRRDHFAAERAQLALAREKGEVLPVAAFEQGAARAHAMVREALDSLPDNLERKAGLNPAGVLLARDVVDAALQDLCDQLQAAYHAAKRVTSDELAAEGRRLIEEANIADLL